MSKKTDRLLLSVPVVILLLFSLACSISNPTVVSGYIDYIGSSEVFIEREPLHYKYSEKRLYPIEADDQNEFKLKFNPDSTEIAYLTIDDDRYPLALIPGKTLTIEVQREYFPDSVSVHGYPEPWHERYSSYLQSEQELQAQIDREITAFREGEENSVLKLYRDRINVAKRYLSNTPLDIYYHKAIGEYLVKRLENIWRRRGRPGMDPEEERRDIIQEAKDFNFFTYKSLKAQRAGIRDFTNEYANTFGVEDSLEEAFGQQLIQYDVKRLGYETMNKARVSVLQHIEGRRALAYAKMYLIAERIGEMSPKTAEPSYRSYLQEYSDYPSYTGFLRTFYDEVKQVTPGQPAISFTLPNPEGVMKSMEDYRGKYVLLDFWAAWCIPCLDEFPHMRELYREFSRDQFEIVAISIEEDSLAWRNALEQFQNPWPQLYGGNSFQQETFRDYRGGGIPFYILINPEGNIQRYNDIRPSFNLPEVLDSLINRDIN